MINLLIFSLMRMGMTLICFLYHLFFYRSIFFGLPTCSLLAAQTSVKNVIKMGPLYKGTKSSGKKGKHTAKSCYLGKVSLECIIG